MNFKKILHEFQLCDDTELSPTSENKWIKIKTSDQVRIPKHPQTYRLAILPWSELSQNISRNRLFHAAVTSYIFLTRFYIILHGSMKGKRKGSMAIQTRKKRSDPSYFISRWCITQATCRLSRWPFEYIYRIVFWWRELIRAILRLLLAARNNFIKRII